MSNISNNHYHNGAEKPLGRSFDETASKHWTVDIKKMLEHKKFDDTTVCIHKVRHAIRAIKPEAYTPQYIRLGPYHHWREELVGVDAYKLLVSKHLCNQDKAFEELDELAKSFEKDQVPQVRASYDRYLEEDDHSLAWMMVIDGIFLVLFLREHLRENETFLAKKNRTAHLVNRSESAYHSILQDILMFENQIPIFALEPLLWFCDRANKGDGIPLSTMLLNTCKNLCPLKCYDESIQIGCGRITEHAHLLEILYYMIVPKTDHSSSRRECLAGDDTTTDPMENTTQHTEQKKRFTPDISCNFVKLAADIKVPRALAKSKPVKVIISLVTTLLQFHSSMNFQGGSSGNRNASSGSGGSSSSTESNEKDVLQVDEIDIPSVSSLLKAGIDLKPFPAVGPITNIGFDNKNQALHLPKIEITANTEVIIRNLVAYEAEAVSGPLVLARYTELMNGIIDTAKVVERLREKKIIKVRCRKTDEDVAQLWNGMSLSIRESTVPSMDKAIREVNMCFRRKRKVRLIRVLKQFMFCGWKMLMLLLALVLMVLLTIQSFCDIYNCPHALAPVTAPPGP